MTILDYVRQHAEETPDRVAIMVAPPADAADEGVATITYDTLYHKMKNGEELPIPLLGNRWDGDFVLYTTGTTGKRKGVIISQRAVMANSDNLIHGHGYTRDTIFIISGPMDHLGCWSKIFPTLIVGGMLYIVSGGMKSVSEIFRPITTGEGRYGLFLVPSSIRILLQQASAQLAEVADKIDFIEAGGAPLPHPDMLKLCQLLPSSRLYNTYASTETGVICTYNFNDGRCISGCLGRPLKNSSAMITPEGNIACKGDTLMSGYEGEPELTRQVMHDDTVFTADGGWIDEEGMLHITGRKDDIINVGGLKMAPQVVEEAALSHPSVSDCICISHPHPVLGEAPELLVVLSNGCQLDKRALARHISLSVERHEVPLFYRAVDEIKKTPNGKLYRKKYRI